VQHPFLATGGTCAHSSCRGWVSSQLSWLNMCVAIVCRYLIDPPTDSDDPRKQYRSGRWPGGSRTGSREWATLCSGFSTVPLCLSKQFNWQGCMQQWLSTVTAFSCCCAHAQLPVILLPRKVCTPVTCAPLFCLGATLLKVPIHGMRGVLL
jgi:hypothetical protein